MEIDPTNNNVIYIGLNGVYRNANNGTGTINDWNQLSTYQVGIRVSSISIAPSNPRIIYYSLEGFGWQPANWQDGGIFRIELDAQGTVTSHTRIDNNLRNTQWVSGNRPVQPLYYAGITDIAVDPLSFPSCSSSCSRIIAFSCRFSAGN